MKRFREKRKVVSLTLVGIAYALIVIPLIVSNMERQQVLLGRAQTRANPIVGTLALETKPTKVLAAATCNSAPTDIMLIMDTSDSMLTKAGSSGTKLSNAETAAKNFIDIIAKQPNDRIGLVTFDATGVLKSGFTKSFSMVKNQISSLKTQAHTCMQCGIDKANSAISADKRANVNTVVILLTDGLAINVEPPPSGYVKLSVGEKAAAKVAATGNKANGTDFYTIGLGSDKDIDGTFLRSLASDNGGIYYLSPTTDQLNNVYQNISQIIGKGEISGVVFNDANGNGVRDANEHILSGWKINLVSGTNKQTFTSDSSGGYTFTGLCDGKYQLSEVLQKGWTQTVPSNSAGYTPTIANANKVTDNFGNTNKSTTMNMTVYLDGIGNRGDNANPTNSSLSNKSLQHTTINADISVFTLTNQLIAQGPGTLTYNATLGAYTGDVPISTGFPTGQYVMKVKSNTHLSKQLDQIQTITSGKDNTIMPVSLVAGDINNDNALNILDYNLLLNCYSNLSPATDCASETDKANADLNDDGAVNQTDYNLFIRELTTQPGV